MRPHLITIAILTCAPVFAQQNPFFSPGNLVVAVEGCGVFAGTCTSVPNGTGTGSGNSSLGGYGDNQGSPLTLFQFKPAGTTSATYVNSLVLPQTGSGSNLPIASEYGSSSEGTLQLSGTGQYLTIGAYGINAAVFDANPPQYGAAPSNALAQSGSLTGQTYTPVARVVVLIDPNGNVNSASALFNIFNTNNPRSVYTVNGTSAYISGQGSGSDATGGVFFTPLGIVNNSPTAITGLDTTNDTLSQDTRTVQIFNNTLYVSADTKEGSNSSRDYIGTLGAGGTPPTTTVGGPAMLSGYGNTGGTGRVTISSGVNSTGNNLNAGLQINLSPMNYFFANAATLYVADTGNPKNNSGSSSLGNGGLEKWINSSSDGSGTWTLAYTLYKGLNLVANSSGSGTSGLYGLTGTVSGGTVELFATNSTLTDLDQTYLYGVADTLSFTTASQAASESFTLLATAPADSNFKGVSFAPAFSAGGVEITTSPSGLAFTSAGAGCLPGSYTTPQAPVWTVASTCTLSVAAAQTDATTGLHYIFAHWEDGTTNPIRTVSAPGTPITYTATFAAQSTPAIVWAAPAAITFGSALSATQLNATANVPGTFVYNPPAGTVLPVGSNQTLSVTFTPNNTTAYSTATGATTITVNPAVAGPANLVVTNVLTRANGNITVQTTIANTGGTAAINVVLTNAKVAATFGTPLPQTIGTIAPGTSVKVSVTVPGSVGASGAASSLTIGGTYNGGTFSSSARITLP